MNKPKVITLNAASLDGRVALGPNRTQWQEMTDHRSQAQPEAGEVWEQVEADLNELHDFDVKLQGSGSFVVEGEELRALPTYRGNPEVLREDFLPEEAVKDPKFQVWLGVVDGQGRMRSGYRGEVEEGIYMLHLTSLAAPTAYLAFLRDKSIPYLIAGENRVDLAAVMEKLNVKLGVNSVLAEGGGALHGALLRAGLVDEVNVIFRPELIGGTNTPALFDSPDLGPDQPPTPLKLIWIRTPAGGYLWVRSQTL